MALAESLTADCPFASDQRVGKMPFKDVVDPEQLAVLTAVLNDICLAAGIDPQSPESEDSTGLLMHLYRIGCHTADELKDALEATRQQEWCC